MNAPHTPNTAGRAAVAPAFVYRHAIGFEETNVVGNVYYAKHISWQGRCREMFLKAHAPGVLQQIYDDLRLVTLNIACDYYDEFHAFDEVEVHMRLEGIWQHRVGMTFDYYLGEGDQARLMAVGRQTIGCMRATQTGMEPIAPPDELRAALEKFAAK
ncbi:acyl-CoA thioesterase [Primorskyibacter sp. 2E107]|uniref:acyl-CoA thioesterase n=1 Tax=Primorskyibacter sp. 2E107 TaxID=3403458 RepID=UPI003AF943CD